MYIGNMYEQAVNQLCADSGCDRQLAIDYLATKRPTSDLQLNHYFEFFWGVKVPMQKHCTHCDAPFQAYADAYFARYVLIILKASRGSGKSLALAALALTMQCTMATDVFILGASEEQSRIIMKYIMSESTRNNGLFWECPNAPIGLKDPKSENKMSNRLVNDGLIECLPASEKNVRGRRPTRLLCDEVDEHDNELLESALGCPKDDYANNIRQCTLLVSTHQNPDGTLTQRIKWAKEANKSFKDKYPQGKLDEYDGLVKHMVMPVYSYCYKDVLESNGGWQKDEEIERLKEKISPERWESEYECGEPNLDGRVFSQAQIDFMFDSNIYKDEQCPTEFEERAGIPISLDKTKIFPEQYKTYKGSVRIREAMTKVLENLDFGCGADFANSVDWSVFIAMTKNPFDKDAPYYITDYARYGRLEKFTTIVELWDEFVEAHPGGAYHDQTGNLTVSELVTSGSTGFTFSKTSKTQLLQEYINAIENRKIKCPNIDYVMREHKFFTFDMLSGKEHLPDSIAACALAYKAACEAIGSFNIGLVTAY